MDDNILKGGGGGIGSHGADGKGGGIENGNPGIAAGEAGALSVVGWVELLASDSALCVWAPSAPACGASMFA